MNSDPKPKPKSPFDWKSQPSPLNTANDHAFNGVNANKSHRASFVKKNHGFSVPIAKSNWRAAR